jgi:lysophospholipase L1-like esterase
VDTRRPISSFRFRPIFGVLGCGLGVLAAGCTGPATPTPVPPGNPPTISCPAAKTAQSPDGNPIPVTYADPTVAGGQSPLTLACTPVSGAIYPVGATTVTCTATDAQRRTSTCSFPVTVVAPAPPHLSLTTFVAFGDSITWGEDGRNTSLQGQSQPPRGRFHPAVQFPLPETYPGALTLELGSRYRTQSPTVANAGQPGEAVTNPLTFPRFDGVVASGRYAVVLLMEGANDLPGAATTPPTIAIPAIIDGLRRMIVDAKGRGIRPYLATIPPEFDGCCPSDRGTAHLLVPGFNDLVRGLAFEQAVPLVDVYVALNTNVSTYIGPDGLHPTAQGYAKMADTFFGILKQTLETAQPGGSIGLRGSPPRSGSIAAPAADGPASRAAVRTR